MSDFRIPLRTDDIEFSDRELEWSQATRRWSLSDKEYGSVTWQRDLEPSEGDLEELLQFFEIPKMFNLNLIGGLSPAELAVVHAQSNESTRIWAALCDECGGHWLVYKLSDTTWQKYGRKCSYGWWLGEPVEGFDAFMRKATD